MKYVKTIGMGILLGFIIGIFGFIPFCSCFTGPFLSLFGGFLLTKITKIVPNDYATLSMHLIVYSIAGALIGTVLNYVINMFYGPTFTSVIAFDGITITGIFNDFIFPFLYVGLTLFIFGAIGGIVYMFTKK